MALLLLLLIPIFVFAADQNTTATIVSTETAQPYSAFTDLNAAQISSSTQTHPYDRYSDVGVQLLDQASHQKPYSAYSDITTTQTASEISTPPQVASFSYNYDPDSNQLTVSFTLTDTNNTPIYVNVYAVTDTNVIPLASGVQVSSGQQYSHTYTLGEEPQGVYISFIAAAPGQYPPTIHIFAPEFEIGTTIIPFSTDYAGNVVISVTNGYSISPIESTPNTTMYAVATTEGIAGIYVQAKTG